MSTVIAHMSRSVDGFGAGSDQSLDNPVGVGGIRLHQWHFDPVGEADAPWRDQLLDRGDAYIMGRNMFAPIRAPWKGDWRGWSGGEPPYHGPVLWLTHHAREPVEMLGGTTFHFLSEAFDAALRRAREAGRRSFARHWRPGWAAKAGG